MSKTAAAGSVKISPNVPGKRLGVKIYAGESVRNGNIIVRQRGTVFHAGRNTKLSRDHSIYAVTDGFVNFRRMSGHKRGKYFVDVLDAPTQTESAE
ncbi:MAG: 50S ribosomal protein L27 [Candidatus Dojkabacteria bacterium]|nr:MAG: 50S ribosomal protein L27 [Candidatus Dojkabacteria bacterium]